MGRDSTEAPGIRQSKAKKRGNPLSRFDNGKILLAFVNAKGKRNEKNKCAHF